MSMEITRITPQVKDKTRCNIEVDGRFFCGMKLETVVLNRLKAGCEVTAEELSAMQLESEKQTALDKALCYISASMKTEKEVRDHLKKKGYLEDVISYAVEKMKSYGYLDDAAYAAAYVQSAGKRKGSRLIALELRQKGIAEEEALVALEALSGEEESAKKLLEKYFRGKEIDQKTLRKGYSYLLGKGYDGETARLALRAFGEEDED